MKALRRLTPPITPRRVLVVLAGLLILKVTGAVVLNYRNYFPPNFESDFLQGRELYFWGGYHWAFYVHLLAGPPSLILGLVLLSERFRLRFPKWHRCLGRIQGMAVVLLLAPSGRLIISLRFGPSDHERTMYPVSRSEVERLGQEFGLRVLRVAAGGDSLGRPEVRWETVVLEYPEDAIRELKDYTSPCCR